MYIINMLIYKILFIIKMNTERLYIHMSRVKKFLLKTTVKSIILAILPIIYTILVSIIISMYNVVNGFILIFIAICLFITHIIFLIYYGKNENTNIEEKANERVQAYKSEHKIDIEGKKFFISTNKTIQDNANSLYSSISKIKSHSYITEWEWLQARGDELCKNLYEFVNNIAEKGDAFSVNIIFRKIENDVSGFTMMSRSATDQYTPSIYRGFISDEDAKGYYYEKIFDKSPTKPEILMDKKQIKRIFKSIEADYSQYIALPISCTGNKMVGLLQIVAYRDSRIASKKVLIEKLCNDYFTFCANIILLSNKCENTIQILKENYE